MRWYSIESGLRLWLQGLSSAQLWSKNVVLAAAAFAFALVEYVGESRLPWVRFALVGVGSKARCLQDFSLLEGAPVLRGAPAPGRTPAPVETVRRPRSFSSLQVFQVWKLGHHWSTRLQLQNQTVPSNLCSCQPHATSKPQHTRTCPSGTGAGGHGINAGSVLLQAPYIQHVCMYVCR